jgi:16S rRNA (adenine1518-N6/adenine1519-N6)-dimethyltransferase
VAQPGTGDYGPLTIAVAQQADVSRVFVLPPGAFRPPPKVHSAVVRLAFRPDRVAVADAGRLDAIVRHVFTQRRKMLAVSLGALAKGEGADAAGWLRAADIDGTRRPETLTLEEFARLADASRV